MAEGTDGAYIPATGRVVSARGVTDVAGNVTFSWPAGTFTVPPVVTATLEAAAGFRSWSVTANTATSTTVHVLGAPIVTLLGIQILAAAVPASGITVHVTATAAP